MFLTLNSFFISLLPFLFTDNCLHQINYFTGRTNNTLCPLSTQRYAFAPAIFISCLITLTFTLLLLHISPNPSTYPLTELASPTESL